MRERERLRNETVIFSTYITLFKLYLHPYTQYYVYFSHVLESLPQDKGKPFYSFTHSFIHLLSSPYFFLPFF